MDFHSLTNIFRPELINVYGVGGTGSWLTEMLARYQFSQIGSNNYPTIRYIDGDTISQNNLLRQLFPSIAVGQLKADVLMKKHISVYPKIQTLPEYLYPEDLNDELAIINGRKVVMFLSVDSIPFRKMMMDKMDSYTNDYIIICPGNREFTFTVHTYGRINGKLFGRDPRTTQPTLANADVANMFRRNGGGCGVVTEDLESTGRQLLLTNFSAAFESINNYRLLVEQQACFTEIVGNINGGVSRMDIYKVEDCYKEDEPENVKNLESTTESDSVS